MAREDFLKYTKYKDEFLPILDCYPVEGVRVKGWCIYCRCWHFHGTGGKDVRELNHLKDLGFRVPHCHNLKNNPFSEMQYYLIFNKTKAVTPYKDVKYISGLKDIEGEDLFKFDFLKHNDRKFLENSFVYFLSNNDEIIYIGKTDYLKNRICQHIREKSKEFDEVFYILTPLGNNKYIEELLIDEIEPIHNKHHNMNNHKGRS